MRLLRFDDSGEPTISKFSSNVPPYAILSHTWGAEEVSFTDVERGVYKSKVGYRKILFCGEQARRDNLLYFWVDTCCIDKRDLHELTKAINSMFRWYQGAAKCYAYLTDVSLPTPMKSQLDQRSWEEPLRKSKWFRRGWTLQELIAPASVEFFSLQQDKIGDKRSLEQLISNVTGVPAAVLRGQPLRDISVTERMVWASARVTTEEEDAAYCLLGVLGVCMPLIYGEGKQNALLRLQREVAASTTKPEKVPFIVPFERNHRFLGRESELAELEEKLCLGSRPRRIAITGLGGIGKTQVALELAHRTRARDKSCAVLWIPATNAESVHQAYKHIADELEIQGRNDKEADIKRLVQSHLSLKKSGRWLLILDNVDDASLWIDKTRKEQEPNPELAISLRCDVGTADLIDGLPKSEQGQIVFTTRNRKIAVKVASSDVLELREVDEDVGKRMLTMYLVGGHEVGEEEARLLLKDLAHLPLAIVQAVAYMNANNVTLREYSSLLAEQELDIVDLLSEDFEDTWRYRDAKNPIAVTWLISFDHIRRVDALAAEYLSFMACIDRKAIPQSLLPPGPSQKRHMDAVGTLDAFSFITKRRSQAMLELHRLVHLATRNWLRKQKLLNLSIHAATTRMLHLFPDDKAGKRTTWMGLLPHARYLLASAPVEKDAKTEYTRESSGDAVTAADLSQSHRPLLLEQVGLCLHSDARSYEAQLALQEAREAIAKTLGDEHPKVLQIMNNIASTLRGQGQYEAAEQLCRQVMTIQARLLGREHLHTLHTMNSLAIVLQDRGKLQEAGNLIEEAFLGRQKVLGAEHPHTLFSMNSLAIVLLEQSNLEAAESLFRQALQSREKVLCPEHPQTLSTMSHLAVLLQLRGKRKVAEEMCRRVLEARERLLGNGHPQTLTTRNKLATLLRSQGSLEAAEQLFRMVLEGRTKTLGWQHPQTTKVAADLAAVVTARKMSGCSSKDQESG